MRISVSVAAVALLLSASVAARADDIYTVTVSNLGADDGSYTFDESSILTSSFSVSAADLSSSTGAAISSIFIDPTSGSCPAISQGGFSACVQVDHAIGGLTDSFLSSPLTSTGNVSNGNVSVDIEPATSVTPEPSSLVLLGTGLLGVVGAVRRRVFA